VLALRVPQAVAGLAIELPPGFEAQVRPEWPAQALHHRANAPATIDPATRRNQDHPAKPGKAEYRIHPGDRIAQLAVAIEPWSTKGT
jgi:dUTPase